MDLQLQGLLKKAITEYRLLQRDIASWQGEMRALRQACENQPQSPTAEIDSIPGRRLFYGLAGQQNFTISQNGLQGQPIQMLVSQDGPVIVTHYPVVLWKPNTPSNATNFGRWSPPYSWPNPTQQNSDTDFIDISYQVMDGGTQRNLQNQNLPPYFSRPDNLIPLPIPTLFAPNAVVTFIPFYERIAFDSTAAIPATGGTLVVAFPSFRAVNL